MMMMKMDIKTAYPNCPILRIKPEKVKVEETRERGGGRGEGGREGGGEGGRQGGRERERER